MKKQSNNFLKYGIVLSNTHDSDLYIKWNVDSFVSNGCSTGYIVQHMSIKSNVSSLKNDDYWECWHIKDGVLENQHCNYDDKWSPIFPPFIEYCEKEIRDSPNGIVQYSAEVYWIPVSSDKYSVISHWKPIANGPAGELPMVYEFECDISQFFMFHRFYEWDYKKELLKHKGGD